MGGFFLGGPTDAIIFAEQGLVEITVFALTGLFGGGVIGRAGEEIRIWRNYREVEPLSK